MKEEPEQGKNRRNYIISIYFGEEKNDYCRNNCREEFRRIYKKLEICLKSKNKEYIIGSFESINSFYVSLEESDFECFAGNLEECIDKLKNIESNKNIEYKIDKASDFSSD
ncbi:MAG: hypothetical protein ACP5H9_02330 [Candidatus Woesearchaeota archaeon]